MQTGMIRLRFMESKEMRERGASRKKAGSRPEKTGGESNFVVQGSILAIASIVVRIIGIAYRIPMINIMGDEGMGYYGTAFNVYNIALLLSSYSLPLAVSKMVSVRLARKQYRNSVRILRAALVYATVVGALAAAVIWFGADFFYALCGLCIKDPGSHRLDHGVSGRVQRLLPGPGDHGSHGPVPGL